MNSTNDTNVVDVLAPPNTTVTVSSTTRSGSDQPTTTAPPPSTQPTTTATASAMTVEEITDIPGWTHTTNKNDRDDIEIEWRRSIPEGQAKIRLRLVYGTIREEID